MRHTELSEINALCDAIEKYAIELNFFNITSSDIDVIISTVNAIKDFLTSKIEEYYENPEGKKNFDSKAYQLYEKLDIANEFNDYQTNTTVRVAVSPYIILAGDGGVGKSHLIADYIDNCDSLGQTSLLLLGQQFSAGMDVLTMLNHSFALFLVLTLWGVGCLKLKVTQQCTTKNITGLMRILSLITHIIVV